MLECANEAAVVLFNYSLLLMTDFNLDEPSKVEIGLVPGVLIALVIVCNLGYSVEKVVTRHLHHAELLRRRKAWREYMSRRAEAEEVNYWHGYQN